jgi:predicted MFS family arabinose efflux permease
MPRLSAAAAAPSSSSSYLGALNKTPATPDGGCKSSPACVLGRPHTAWVCGLPASLAGSIFAASGITGIPLRAPAARRRQNARMTAAAQPPQASSISPDARLRLAACTAAAALLQIDGTIVTVALPSVGDELSVNPHSLSLVLMAYFAAYGVIGAVAQSFAVLIVSRLVQGLGAGLVSPASLAGAVSGYPPERRASALALWGASSGAANLIGPVIGGLLTVTIDWRACWWFLVPCAALVAMGIRRFVPSEVHASETVEAAGLRQRVVAAAALVAALTFVVMIGAFFIAQQYLQETENYSALGAASALTLIALLVGVGAPLAAYLTNRHGEGRTAMIGFASAAFGLLALGIPGAPLHGLGAMPLLVPFGIGIGLLFVPASRAALNAVPQAKHGRVSSLLSMSRLLGAAAGAGLAGLALTGGVTKGNVHTALLVAGIACLVIGLPAAAELSPRGEGRSPVREAG